MNRCGHLYTNTLYIEYKSCSCHSQSQSHSHISRSAYISSVIRYNQRSFNCFHLTYARHCHCWSMMRSMQPSSNCQFLTRNITHWSRIKMRSVTHRRPSSATAASVWTGINVAWYVVVFRWMWKNQYVYVLPDLRLNAVILSPTNGRY